MRSGGRRMVRGNVACNGPDYLLASSSRDLLWGSSTVSVARIISSGFAHRHHGGTEDVVADAVAVRDDAEDEAVRGGVRRRHRADRFVHRGIEGLPLAVDALDAEAFQFREELLPHHLDA